MGKFILKRLVSIIVIFFIASIIIFLLVRIAPGDVAASIAGGGKTTQATLDAIRVKYHLNDSIFVQYGVWIRGIFQGDWGTSFQMKTPVLVLITGRMGLTFQLILMGFVTGILVSLPLGIISAVRQGTYTDHVISVLTTVTAACPAYFIGMLCMLLFSYRLGWFPVYGSGNGFVQNLYFLFLPALSIGLGMVAMNAKNLRASMIAAHESNYILTARAKGLSNRRIIMYHTLKNAVVPYFTISGLEVASILGSTSIIERTFSISGIGSLLVDAVAKNDYPVVQGVTLVIVVLVLLINLAVDVLSALMDPRIRIR